MKRKKLSSRLAPLRIGVLGASGRMGTHVTSLLAGEFASRAVCTAQPARGESLETLLACDAVIDFSSPEAVLSLLRLQSRRFPPLVMGSTGWSEAQLRELKRLARGRRILRASNFSLGAQLAVVALRAIAPALLRAGYAPSIVESHHVHKKDAPSGTALTLAQAIEAAGSVPIQSIREGEIIGEHTVRFEGAADRLEISHSAQDRSLFARGAIEVALWLARARGLKNSAILGMDDYARAILKQRA